MEGIFQEQFPVAVPEVSAQSLNFSHSNGVCQLCLEGGSVCGVQGFSGQNWMEICKAGAYHVCGPLQCQSIMVIISSRKHWFLSSRLCDVLAVFQSYCSL